jgi:hypothetical protein
MKIAYAQAKPGFSLAECIGQRLLAHLDWVLDVPVIVIVPPDAAGKPFSAGFREPL